MSKTIYKIVTVEDWDKALEAGVFKGAAVDLADGYIHFSTREQVEETARNHFYGQHPLLLVAFDAARFGDDLKWEPSRGGDLFPHLYQTLDPNLSSGIYPLPIREDGGHDFPEDF